MDGEGKRTTTVNTFNEWDPLEEIIVGTVEGALIPPWDVIMTFDLGKFFEDIFKPAKGEKVTVMYDLPHGDIADSDAWKERRQMAEDWRENLAGMADRWGISVHPTVTYPATGSNNADLPSKFQMGDREVTLDELLEDSTIIIAMPQFSATAPLYPLAKSSKQLRVGSMPGVAKFMEETGLSADYSKIEKQCKKMEPIFNQAVAAEVEFSTGQRNSTSSSPTDRGKPSSWMGS
jgi:hypothetical protein